MNEVGLFEVSCTLDVDVHDCQMPANSYQRRVIPRIIVFCYQYHSVNNEYQFLHYVLLICSLNCEDMIVEMSVEQ